jgi:hypothetical protein
MEWRRQEEASEKGWKDIAQRASPHTRSISFAFDWNLVRAMTTSPDIVVLPPIRIGVQSIKSKNFLRRSIRACMPIQTQHVENKTCMHVPPHKYVGEAQIFAKDAT